MKSLYICGDSFGYPDPVYGPCWTELLADKLTNYKTVNLSRVCASNLQIATQVDKAINDQADFVLYLMTTSTREEVLHREKTQSGVIDRFTNIAEPEKSTDLTSYSIFSLDHTTILNRQQLQLLQKYHKSFFDLDLTIYKNELIIESVLNRLEQSQIPFVYDQGGFENTRFTNTKDKVYFKRYLKHKSGINLWNFARTKKHRPYYHIEDPKIHEDVACYYYKIINEQT